MYQDSLRSSMTENSKTQGVKEYLKISQNKKKKMQKVLEIFEKTIQKKEKKLERKEVNCMRLMKSIEEVLVDLDMLEL